MEELGVALAEQKPLFFGNAEPKLFFWGGEPNRNHLYINEILFLLVPYWGQVKVLKGSKSTD